MNNEDDCRMFLRDRFGITMPEHIWFVRTQRQGIRVYSKTIDEKGMRGLKGFACYSSKKGLNNFFIQQIGHLAKRNVVALNRDDARKYLLGQSIKKSLTTTNGYVIVVYKGHVLGLGRFENGTIFSRLKGIRRQTISDDLKTYPNRRL